MTSNFDQILKKHMDKANNLNLFPAFEWHLLAQYERFLSLKLAKKMSQACQIWISTSSILPFLNQADIFCKITDHLSYGPLRPEKSI